MTKQRVVFMLVLCSLVALLAVQALSEARSSGGSSRASEAERRGGMTDAERKREIARRRKETKLARERMKREIEKKSAERRREMGPLREQHKLESEKMRKELEKAKKEAGGFLFAKYALGATQEQWKLIKAKLEKVRLLRDQSRSGIGMSLTGGSSDSGTRPRAGARTNVPTWQWKRPWKDKAPGELTEAQRLTKQLIALVERRNTTPETLRRKMAALRKARGEEAERQRQWSEAREELREILTTRQEAALVLLKWL